MHKYFEDRLSVVEKTIIEQHIKDCDLCKCEFETTKTIFDMLSYEEPINPPDNFTDMVIEKTEKLTYPKNFYDDRIAAFAKSLVTAGIIIFILNFMPVNIYDNINFSKFSIDIDKVFYEPFININKYLDGGIL
jgi:hypothetical protein